MPVGLAYISVIWVLGGFYNLYLSTRAMNSDANGLQYLSNPNVNPWFQTGLPADLALNFFLFLAALSQFLTVYGIFKRRRWAYWLALAVPLLVAAINLSFLAEYYSAPLSLNLRASLNYDALVFSLLFAAIYLLYLRRPYVRMYFGVDKPLGPKPKQKWSAHIPGRVPTD